MVNSVTVARALSNLDSLAWGSGYATFCETFTEEMAQCGWQGESAIDAWQRNQRRATDVLALGLAVYFDKAPGNEFYGHTGIVTAVDEFVSVTFNGVKKYAISWWEQHEAPLLGFVNYDA